MGSYNRDYMQDDYQPNGPAWGHDVPTTKWLIIVTVVVFFLQTILVHRTVVEVEPAFSGLKTIEYSQASVVPVPAAMNALQAGGGYRSYIEEWCLLDASKVLRGQVWRLVTFVFCHNRAQPFSLAMNMIAVWFLGASLERMYGSREILWFYLASALVCGVIFTGFALKLTLPYPLFGAEPCVMALLTLYCTHFPRREVLFFWVVPVEIRVLLGIYVAIDVYRILQVYSGASGIETVAYLSELWGIGFAYLYRRFDLHLTGMMESFDLAAIRRSLRRVTSQRQLKVFAPEPSSNLDEQLDAILAKIHEHGSESLNERERSLLQQASERAKNRM